jgi:hypothetical protein
MSAFDAYLTKLRGYVEEMRGRGRQVREIDCPATVSCEAAAKGFGLETLGRALMAILKSQVAKVRVLEILLVTSSREDVERLDEVAAQVRHIGQNIVRQMWLAKGLDILERTFGWDCRSGEYEPVCDDVRRLVTVSKRKTRESKTVANA